MRTITPQRSVELSLALHRAVMPFMYADWPATRTILLRNLSRMKEWRLSTTARSWVSEWETAVERGPDAVEKVAFTPGERGADLRQMSPFAGVLPEGERLKVLEQFTYAPHRS